MQYIFTAILSIVMGLLIGLIAIDDVTVYRVVSGIHNSK